MTVAEHRGDRGGELAHAAVLDRDRRASIPPRRAELPRWQRGDAVTYWELPLTRQHVCTQRCCYGDGGVSAPISSLRIRELGEILPSGSDAKWLHSTGLSP